MFYHRNVGETLVYLEMLMKICSMETSPIEKYHTVTSLSLSRAFVNESELAKLFRVDDSYLVAEDVVCYVNLLPISTVKRVVSACEVTILNHLACVIFIH